MSVDKIRSKYLNQLIAATNKRDHEKMDSLLNCLYASNGLPHIGFRKGNKVVPLIDVYEEILSPAAQCLEKDITENGLLAYEYKPEQRYIDNKDLAFSYSTAIISRPKALKEQSVSELEFLSALEKKDDEELLNAYYGPEKAQFYQEERDEIISKIRKEIANQKELLINGYHGKYPEVNRLFKNICALGLDSDYKFSSVVGVDFAFCGDENKRQPSLLPPINRVFLWSYLRTLAVVVSWCRMQKIYRVADALAKDFIRQEQVYLPYDALKYLPYTTFAIDVSRNSELAGYFDCVFVNVVKYNNEYNVIYEVMDPEFIHATSGMQCGFEISPEEEYEEFVINEESQKERWRLSNIRKWDLYKMIAQAKAETNHTKTEYWDAPDEFLKFKAIPPSAYKKLERFVLGTIFYLCCTNKSVRKTAVKSENETKTEVKQRAANKSEAKTMEVEDLGLDVEDALTISFNKLTLEEKEIRSSSISSNHTGKSRKPHLVSGHFQHFRCGKGRTEVVYKYVKPYYTGTKTNVVSVTTLA